MSVKSKLVTVLAGLFSKELTIVLVAMLPILELRGAIPLGILGEDVRLFGIHGFGMHPLKVYMLALLGNMIPVYWLLVFLKKFFHRLQTMRFVGKFFKWWFASVERRSGIIQRWGFWGLVCFVAIPLPVTGAWTGAAAATLLEIDTKKACIAIFLGVACAGFIMTALSLSPEVFISWFTSI